jgi:cvfA/B/C family virulence factor
MAATLTVIWWRDIPAQVIAKDRRQSHKIVLHPRFQVAIDRAAVKAGLREWNGYLEQWHKDQRACGEDVKAEAEAEATRLEAEYPKEALNRLVETGGIDSPDAADSPEAADNPRAADGLGAP